ncbi:hypothetical protein [Brevundimonas viscosa]|uniref:Group 4 capsule polysaccharide lipoprotein gfcB, YjbF n=1 Tax=Brevundimonas viscosa TaxID=871741 RepID=A0A1I6Q2Q0_9CAUL|nr:hypothetical protein [Brevundimonas viscosa]SFS46703.1 hypothetical protein SAMN05192570_1505 [Brevundimonas viscosa]
MPLSMLIGLLIAQDPAPPPQDATAIGDVVVVGRAPPRPDPFEIFRALCFDANRLDGRAFRPTMVTQWRPMAGASPFGDGAAGGETFIRREGDLEMVLRIDEGPDEVTARVKRNVCSLTLVGPHDQQSLERGMSAALRAGGTRTHLNYETLYPTWQGWTQLAWTAIPQRRQSRWSAFAPGHRDTSGFVVVTDASFYRENSYLVTELRYTNREPRPVSHITMTYLTRDEP